MPSFDRRCFLALPGLLAAANGLPLTAAASEAGKRCMGPRREYLWINPWHSPQELTNNEKIARASLKAFCIGDAGWCIAPLVSPSTPAFSIDLTLQPSEFLTRMFPDSHFVALSGTKSAQCRRLEAALECLLGCSRGVAVENQPRAVIASALESIEAANLAVRMARLCRSLYREVIALVACRATVNSLPLQFQLALGNLDQTSDRLIIADDRVMWLAYTGVPGEAEWSYRASYLADIIERL